MPGADDCVAELPGGRKADFAANILADELETRPGPDFAANKLDVVDGTELRALAANMLVDAGTSAFEAPDEALLVVSILFDACSACGLETLTLPKRGWPDVPLDGVNEKAEVFVMAGGAVEGTPRLAKGFCLFGVALDLEAEEGAGSAAKGLDFVGVSFAGAGFSSMSLIRVMVFDTLLDRGGRPCSPSSPSGLSLVICVSALRLLLAPAAAGVVGGATGVAGMEGVNAELEFGFACLDVKASAGSSVGLSFVIWTSALRLPLSAFCGLEAAGVEFVGGAGVKDTGGTTGVGSEDVLTLLKGEGLLGANRFCFAVVAV